MNICREINCINIEDDIAIIDSDNQIINEIFDNDDYNDIIKSFFQKRNLGFKLKKIYKEETDFEKLNKMLGGKVIKISKIV